LGPATFQTVFARAFTISCRSTLWTASRKLPLLRWLAGGTPARSRNSSVGTLRTGLAVTMTARGSIASMGASENTRILLSAALAKMLVHLGRGFVKLGDRQQPRKLSSNRVPLPGTRFRRVARACWNARKGPQVIETIRRPTALRRWRLLRPGVGTARPGPIAVIVPATLARPMSSPPPRRWPHPPKARTSPGSPRR
jgi:hypothetical protein